VGAVPGGDLASANKVLFKLSFAIFIVVIVVGTFLAVPRGTGQATASEAEAAAEYWVGSGVVQPARVEDDEWEVDVVRPDGSLVEVTIDHDLRLRNLDEELGRRGSRAHDEVEGPLRDRAARAALELTGPGHVTGVERDARDEIEVGILLRDGRHVEVELDSRLRVGEVEEEDPDDE
jgi:hypothetical protein